MNSHLLPILALMIAVGIFFVYVHPTWSGSIALTKQAIATDVQALAAADEYKANQNALAAARDAIDPANLERLKIFLPDSVDNVGLILNINALAARSGLSLSNIDVAKGSSMGNSETSGAAALPTDEANPVGSIDLSLSAVGSYAALQAFLAGLEKSARLLDIRDITVKGSDTGVYNYQMTVRLYWLR
ncbi:TPA: hypothetical protein DIV48_03325 [Candidatus Kaiserbacteria bacterium]|nr:MAG: hypothetical protein UY93_C0003G0067 [Parcubacteria group bacterium GW2011_GWA1_56_13]KKW45829.1 MAG: hypothetical protein UY97_C0014G0027 [Parcubacteria group bacterium GW2011_GWB1_57_6]HCR52644.1 hypothetical protein [Candidatus Kaiserbacteria bacterium]